MKTKNSSPSRSQGAQTPRRKSRRTLSVGSPALSTASGRLTSIVQGFVNQQMDSFVLSPLPKRRSVLTDNTEVMEEPRRKSWWKKLNENSRDALEALEDNNEAEPYNIMEELDMEILSQEPRKEKNITVDIPESDGESIHSIVIPQKKLFPQKENRHQKFDQIIGNRESMTKSNKNMTINDIVVNAGRKELFQNHPRSKPLFPAALLDVTPDKTIMNKTKEPAEPKQQTRNLFGNRQGTKRKNMFANFIASESEDEIPEIQPKIFQFPKKLEPIRRGSSASRGIRDSSPISNVTTDTDMDEWRLLPSSTMVEHQLEVGLESNTPKRPCLSKLSETKESSGSSVPSKTKSPEANTSVLTRSKLRALNNSTTSTGGGKNKTLHEKSQKNQSKRNSFRKIVNERREIVGSEQDEEQNQKVDNENVIVEVAQEANQSHKEDNEQNELNISRQKAINVNQEIAEDYKINERQEIEVNHEVEETEQDQDENQKEESDIKDNESQEIAQEDVEESHNQINESQEEEDENEDHLSKSKEELDESMEQEDEVDHSQEDINENNEVQNEIQEESENEAVDEDENVASEANNEASVNQELKESGTVNEHQEIEATHEEVEKTEEEQNENQEKESEKNDNRSLEMAEGDEESQNQINVSQEEKNENEDHVSENKEELDESMEQEDEVDHSQQEVDENNEAIDQSQVDDDDDDEENVAEIDQSVDAINQINEVEDEENNLADKSQELDKGNQEANESIEVNEIQMKVDEEIDENNQKANESNLVTNESNEEVNHTQENDNENNEVEEIQEDGENEAVDEDENEVSEAENEIFEAENEVSEAENEVSENENEVSENENEVSENEEEASEAENEVSENENEVSKNENEVSENEDEASENENEVSENEDEASEAENEVSENVNEVSENEDENENVEDENEAVDEDESENAELHYESASEEMEVDDGLQKDQDDTIIDKSNKTNTPEPAHNESNISHDTTGRNRHKHKHTSPEAILHDKSQRSDSFTARRNTSIRENKTIGNLLRGKPSLMPARDSVGFSDGTTNSSAEGSGWDSHRTTRKTIRQTFGRDATPRKSLRALVMEKSAKRQTMPYNSTAVSGMPEISLGFLDIQPIPQESAHEVSLRTRQLTLDAVLDKVKEDNLKRKAEIEEAVKKSLATRSDAHIFKVPARPMFPRRQGNQQNKTSKVNPMWRGLPNEVIEDLQYKPPKRFKPTNAPWITKRLYKFLENKLEPKYDYKARVRAEKLVETVYNFTKELRRQTAATEESTNELKHEMARLQIVKTHHEFYEFFRQYMPKEIRIKVIPDVVNKLPLPRRDVFSDIIPTDSMRG